MNENPGLGDRFAWNTQSYGLLAPELLEAALDGRVKTDVDAAWAQQVMAELDTSRLSNLVVADIAVPAPEIFNDPRNLANFARSAGAMGADEATERVVMVTFGGELYLVGFGLARYGDEWGVVYQSSNIGGLSPLGTAQPTTIDEYEELTSE